MNFQVVEEASFRWYKKDNFYYPSVSTVNNWEKNINIPRYRRRAGDPAQFGTAVHHQLANLIMDDFGVGRYSGMPDINIWGTSYDIDRMNRAMKMWFNFLKDNPSFKPIESELALFMETQYKYAGRLDIIAKINNELYLIDFKTGNYYPEYNLQVCGGYGCLARYNGFVVDHIALLFLDTDLSRNPSQNYKFKVYSNEERIAGEQGFRSKIERYYNSVPSVYDRVMSGE